jgi:hypothetical protein
MIALLSPIGIGSQGGLMQADSTRAHSHAMSGATRCAVVALILLLGALGLFLIGCNQFWGLEATTTVQPNSYVCQVNCSKGAFIAGAHVQTTIDVVVRLDAGGADVGQEPAGATGTVTEGPRPAQGSNERWWRVQFDDNLLGWVPEGTLIVTDGTEVVINKALEACVPVTWNKNRPEYEGDPGPSEISDDCRVRVKNAFLARHAMDLPPSTFCTFKATTTITKDNASCDNDCMDPSGVCTSMGLDPDPPLPDPISVAVFSPMTVCEVTGTADLRIGGHAPKVQPGVRGTVHILGTPCPGQSCRLGVAFKLEADDIEFDSGSIFASDPKFVGLKVFGATEPNAVQVGPFLGCTDCSFGGIGPQAAYTAVQGKRSLFLVNGLPSRMVSFRNTESVAVAVNWVNKTCRLAGDLGGTGTGGVVGDGDEGQLAVSADVALDGVLVNQPPHPDTSKTKQSVECTSADLTAVTLDGSGSTDPDGNIAFYTWRHDSDTGAHVADPSTNPVVTTQQGRGPATYDLRVVDGRFAADHAPVTISVVDTTAPTIACNVPATITPNDVPEGKKTGLSFKATASDTCSGISQIAIKDITCTKPNSCKVTSAGDTLTILDSGGVGDVISWTVSARDGSGNEASKLCQISVIKK